MKSELPQAGGRSRIGQRVGLAAIVVAVAAGSAIVILAFVSGRSSSVVGPPVRLALLSSPVALPAPLSTGHVGPYWFVRGPLVVRPGNLANSGNDAVEVFLRMNRPLPSGRINVTVNGAGAEITAGGTGIDIDASDATRWCYEVTVGDTETLTNNVSRYHAGEVVTVRVNVDRGGGIWSEDLSVIPPGTPGAAQARIRLGQDSFPNTDPTDQSGPGSAFGFPRLGCPM